MRDGEGGGLTYAVVTDELLTAAEAVLEVTDLASAAGVEELPGTVADVGHEGLARAFMDFCARWDNGLSHLVGDSTDMATRLDSCAAAYVETEDASAGGYQRLLSCAPVQTATPVGGDQAEVIWPGGL